MPDKSRDGVLSTCGICQVSRTFDRFGILLSPWRVIVDGMVQRHGAVWFLRFEDPFSTSQPRAVDGHGPTTRSLPLIPFQNLLSPGSRDMCPRIVTSKQFCPFEDESQLSDGAIQGMNTKSKGQDGTAALNLDTKNKVVPLEPVHPTETKRHQDSSPLRLSGVMIATCQYWYSFSD